MNKCLKIGGWSFVLYGVVECIDVVTNICRMLGLPAEKYPMFSFKPINLFFQNIAPVWVLLFVLVPTVFHFMGGLGVLRNKTWGVVLVLFSGAFTMTMVPLFFPYSGIDGIFVLVGVLFVSIGYFNKPIHN